MKKPDWRISIDGTLVDRRRLVSLSTTDNRGLEVDSMTAVFTDWDGQLALPQKGVELALSIGYIGEGLVERGTFIVDYVSHSGPPDMVTVTAKSARSSEKNGAAEVAADDGAGDKFKAGKERSWDDMILADIVTQIAADQGVEPKISEALAEHYFKHIDQTESDAHFLTRLADELDAVATIKAGKLLFLEAGKGENAEGQAIGPIVIKRNEGSRHQYEAAEKGRFTGCSAHWHDATTGKREKVDVGEDGYRKRLQRTYPTEDDAQRAAKSEFARISRGLATIQLDIADPNPALFAETPAHLSGWNKPEIDHENWVITKVTISIDPRQGMDASLEAEQRPET